MLLACVYAILCHSHHPAAIAEWIEAHYDDWLRDELGFTQPARPCRTTVYLFMRCLDWAAVEKALTAWVLNAAEAMGIDLSGEGIALDGKEIRGVRAMSGEALATLSAFTHGTGVTLGLRTFEEGKEQEAARELIKALPLKGRVVTLDALHTQRKTVKEIIGQGADFVLTAKRNQPKLRQRIEALFSPWMAELQDRDRHEAKGRGHGRHETRRLAAVSLPAGLPRWPEAAQAFCVARTVVRDGRHSFETVYGITSLTREEAGPERLLGLVRGHWAIENRSHWVRDVAWQEDAGRAYMDSTAEVMAAARTAILSAFRLAGVKNVSAQLRKNALKPREAGAFLGFRPAPAVL
jgi:predicted transposase YbfD/YdcC